MKKNVFFLFLLPLWSFSQSFTGFALNPNGDVSIGDFVEAGGKPLQGKLCGNKIR